MHSENGLKNFLKEHDQKYSRLVNGLVISFYLGWSGSTLPIRTNMIKVGSKSCLLTCSIRNTLAENISTYCAFCCPRIAAKWKQMTFYHQ
jgi:hypothetical protein